MPTDPMVAMLRRDELATFLSACRITAKGSGEGTTDADGNYFPPEPDVVYEGPCQFVAANAMTRTVDVVGEQVEIHPYKVTVPANTPVERGHVIEITACPDEGAVGRFFVVRAVQFTQWHVNRVLGCEEGVA